MNKARPLDQILSIGAKAADHSANVQNNPEPRPSILEGLWDFVSAVPDFRRTDKGNMRHKLSDILMLQVFARACGRTPRASIIEFGRYNLKKLQKMGMLINGVPSESTLCRVDEGIENLAMANSMQEFTQKFHREILKTLQYKEIICVDGKAERGTILENGRNPDIVSAYSYDTQITLATEACKEKSNEIKAVPDLLEKIDIRGKIVTADAMSMQRTIIDKIRDKGGDFLIELKANQRSLRYGVEDKLKGCKPLYSIAEDIEFGHGRIEKRTYHIYDGLEIIADKEKWGGNMTIIEYELDSIKKSTGAHTTEKRLYVSSLPPDTPIIGSIVRKHWSIESMHWSLDVNLLQDKIKRKTMKSARNLDTIQRIVHSVFSIWKGLRKKRSDKRKGMAELIRYVSEGFTRLLNFLTQN